MRYLVIVIFLFQEAYNAKPGRHCGKIDNAPTGGVRFWSDTLGEFNCMMLHDQDRTK
jgi:hypothetical protein